MARPHKTEPASPDSPPPKEAEPSRKIWRISLAVSIALHAALGATLFLGLANRTASHLSAPPAMAIQLLPMPAAPPTPARLTPPGPQKVENHTRLTPTQKPLDLPSAPVVRDVTPEVVTPPKAPETPPAKPTPAAEQTTAPTAVAAPPKAVAAAPVKGEMMAGADKAEQTWETSVLARLERNKRYPGEAQRVGQEDTIYVHISVDRSGKVLHASIERSRGFASLDRAVLELVQRCSPLPAPPASVSGSTVDFVVPVEFFINRRGR